MIAVNSIYISIISLSFLPLIGVCIGGAIRVGNALGAGKARRASLVGRIIITTSVSIATITMIASVFTARPFASAFTPDAHVIQVTVDLTFELMLIIPLIGFTLGLQTILRACGKQLLAAKFNLVCMFVLGVPLGVYFAMQLGGGLAGLWLGSLLGQVVFTLGGVVWLWRLSWEQLAHEAKHNTHLPFEPSPAADAF